MRLLQVKRERESRGWTQEQLANLLGTSQVNVSRWESGSTFPNRYYRRKLGEIFGKNLQELDEDSEQNEAPSFRTAIEWGEAPHISQFYDRSKDLQTLTHWIANNRCRIVAITGIGGIGKTSLAVAVIKELESTFEYIFWGSLRTQPPLEHFLHGCLQFLSDRQNIDLPQQDIDKQIFLLIEHFRESRCLIILDNFEAVLEAGTSTARYQKNYEGYGKLLQRVGQANHKSCLLLTSRELPKEVSHLQGAVSPIRSLQLAGMERSEGKKLIEGKGLFGSDEEWNGLFHLYSGHPLALMMVAEYIRELFGGDIRKFLQQNKTIFSDMRDLLEPQFLRLSPLEQEIMYWLAIERDPISIEQLQRDLLYPLQRIAVFEALASLRRRAMIEVRDVALFTLRPAVMDFMTTRLVEQVYREIEEAEEIHLLASHALVKAEAYDYIRESQVHFILEPLLGRLTTNFGQDETEKKLNDIVSKLRGSEYGRRGYAAGNILNLLVQLKDKLWDYDFSGLTIRQAYLQNVELFNVNFAHAHFDHASFTDTFGGIFSTAFSPNGLLFAAGTLTGEVRLWRIEDTTPVGTYRGHTQWVFALAFSPSGDILASGSGDRTVRLWKITTQIDIGEDFKLEGHEDWIRAIAFSPDGTLLASGSEDHTIRLWDPYTGKSLRVLRKHKNRILSLAFSPDGTLLASGSEDHTIRLWNPYTGEPLQTFCGHTGLVWSTAFSPDGTLLASGSDDQTIRLWNPHTGECLRTLDEHDKRVRAVAFSPDGARLASGSDDQTIRLWNPRTGERLNVFEGRSSGLKSIAFSPDGKTLISGSEDQTIAIWRVSDGQRLKVLRGYTRRLISLTFSPDGKTLISGCEDKTIGLWDISTGKRLKVLQGHTSRVRTVSCKPKSTIIASGSDDQTIRLWDTRTGRCMKVLLDHTDPVRTVNFNFDGTILASGGDDRTICMWSISPDGTGRLLRRLQEHDKRVRAVAFSPDGALLASGSEDCTVRLWDVSTGKCIKVLQEHRNRVWAVAFSPDGALLASGSEDQTICLWKVDDFEPFHKLQDQSQNMRAIAFSHDGNILATGGNDGSIKLWDVQTGECRDHLKSEKPYEGMNILDAQGLTDIQKNTLIALGAIEQEK